VGALNINDNTNVLVGLDTGDDAGVWDLGDGRALISTVDFITPLVNDARTWGQIAVANSLSDVYAMGGKPLFGLNVVGWNNDELPSSMLSEVLAGGLEIAEQAGMAVIGGHTISDPEPKYGMAVTGEVNPEKMLTNAGLKTDQHLILTKPLGVGVIATAIKAGIAGKNIIDAAVASMTQLNTVASEVAVAAGVTGATDVTGFGLLGHLGKMALASDVDVVIDVGNIDFLPGAKQYAEDGVIPGGTRRNLAWVENQIDAGSFGETDLLLLADAQTSGGLIFGIDKSKSAEACAELNESGVAATVIGETNADAGTGTIRLR
jgi:selenide,water dikinase